MTDEQRKADKGLTCQQCGCHKFRTVGTRPQRDGTIVRNRECRNCGLRMDTVEEEVKG